MDHDGGFFSQLDTVDQLQTEAKAGAVFQRAHRDEERKAREKMPHVLASSGFHAPDVQCVLLARDGIVVVCRLSIETHERHLSSVGVRRDDHLGLLGEIHGRLRSVQCLHDDFAHAAHVGRHTNGAMVESLESCIEFQVGGALRLEGVAQDFDGKVEQGVAFAIVGAVEQHIAWKEGNDAAQMLFRNMSIGVVGYGCLSNWSPRFYLL